MSETNTVSLRSMEITDELARSRAELAGKGHDREYQYRYVEFRVLFDWPNDYLRDWLREHGVKVPLVHTREGLKRRVFEKAFPDG